MGLEFSLRGFEALVDKVDRAAATKRKRLAQAVKACAYLVLGDAKKRILRGEKSGRIYGNHQASKPGESPASDTGNLARSGRVDIYEKYARVIFDAAYALPQEYGTNDGRIAERPFLRPALEANRDAISDLISEALYGN